MHVYFTCSDIPNKQIFKQFDSLSEQSLLSLHPLSLTTVIAYMTGSVCFITSLQTSLRLGIIYAEDKVNQIYSFLGTFWFVRYLIGNFGLSYVML